MNLFFNFLDAYINALAGVAANSGAGVAGTIADAIRNQFMGGDMAKAGNVIVLFMPVVLLTLIMAFMFLQLSTIASSMTSGAGGAVGQGASSLIYYMRGALRSRGGAKSAPAKP